MTLLGLQWYCAFACLLCQSPCSPSLQVHSYISNHQYGFPISLGFPFSHIFPNTPLLKRYVFFFGRGGGGVLVPHCSQNCVFRIFKPPFFPNPTHHFLELRGCVFFFWGGLYQTFPSVPLSTFSIPTYFP